jgi:rubrerythrin
MKVLSEALQEARGAERAQVRFYRALAAAAEAAGRLDEAERLHALHADEQHHLSRLTARLLELGAEAGGEPEGEAVPDLEAWEEVARAREAGEVARYAALLELDADEETRALLRQILESERHHLRELGGKWMPA